MVEIIAVSDWAFCLNPTELQTDS